ncbi:histidine kinase dimerization/phospho-acceptor domain-containing protein [Reichenbachiella ulvae]|uniref:histidine kinase n=1 Tax=Reichenbachiella ulvae TaxID=2980104 RepID=A0ABT3D0C4_9BACT|nr:histidine kinase dimerization/phospho-acceptor domain-containing protein [Reichenbachiella ulvae]MCV9389264.1 hypothetical protein [Reichenbachiella ulvae]
MRNYFKKIDSRGVLYFILWLCFALMAYLFETKQWVELPPSLVTNLSSSFVMFSLFFLVLLYGKEWKAKSEEKSKLSESLKSAPIVIEGGIGDDKRLQFEVYAAKRALRLRDRILAKYAFTNSHEIRQPVANIVALAMLLEKTENAQDQKELISAIKGAAEALDERIIKLNDTLTLTNVKKREPIPT